MNEEIISKVKEDMGTHWDENGGTTEYAIEKALQLQKSQDLKLFEGFVEKLKGNLNMFQMHHWDDEIEEHSDMPIHQSDFKFLKKEIQTLAQETQKEMEK